MRAVPNILLSMAFGFVLLCSSAFAGSGNFAELNPSIRAAWSYLRTGNTDLALIELDTFQTAFASLEQKQEIAAIGNAMSDALLRAEKGDLKGALGKVFEARSLYREKHRINGDAPFEDCIWDANRLGDRLWPSISERPDFSASGVRTAIANDLAAYKAKLVACNTAAPQPIAGDGEFRRLMDGTLPSLDKAIAATQLGDNDTYHRYMIEIISFDRLLYFRFG